MSEAAWLIGLSHTPFRFDSSVQSVETQHEFSADSQLKYRGIALARNFSMPVTKPNYMQGLTTHALKSRGECPS